MPLQTIKIDSTGRTETSDISTLRILCIDSENNWLRYAKRELQCTEFQVDVACSFMKAVEHLCTTEFDLVTLSDSICDVHHYLEILDRCKRAQWLQETPVIVLATRDTVHGYDLAIQHRADGYASRPTVSGTLLPALRKSLRSHQRRQKWLRQPSGRQEPRCQPGIRMAPIAPSGRKNTTNRVDTWKSVVSLECIQGPS